MTFQQGDCVSVLQEYPDNHFDLLVTDPPYGIAFMGKDWDKALPSQKVWEECYRTLKEGKMAFVMCSPRQDVLSRMIISLENAGFRTNYTSIYWTYASGFPKAANISKLIDKNIGRLNTNTLKLKNRLNELREQKGLSITQINKLCGFEASNYFRTDNHLINIFPQGDKWEKIKSILGDNEEIEKELQLYFEEAEREIIGTYRQAITGFEKGRKYGDVDITIPKTDEAKKMEGAYVGFQPKPAVEVILVVSKGKSLTWLDDCRIPYSSDSDSQSVTNIRHNKQGETMKVYGDYHSIDSIGNQKGRFPANLCCGLGIDFNNDDMVELWEALHK